ncbi:MAG TPA: pitrilysin family protein [Thermoanaerobaculaceae bacterium]|nr:pitrilysin family protein [Thermoanaerobaculaceae bacterium]
MSESFRVVAEERGVEELVLERNGLRVLLLPDSSVPVVAVCVIYHVGSRNEAVGHTGSTHLLEHLMFKGSRRFDPSEGRPIARVLERVGAHFNATTWFDRTNYYEILPPEHLELALELEADRMRNALLRESDLATEMTVVRNEFERGENEPFDALLKESFAIAFREHPYHHPTIGWRSDIESTSIARLRAFYDTFYYPDNASLVLVGSFDRTEALELTARYFGPLPRAPQGVPPVVTREPRQEGERRFVVRRAGEVGWVVVSWRTPEAGHGDTHTLAVLADALGGGVTSRLYQRLVETGMCLDVQAMAWQLRDPGLFQVFATLNPPVAHGKVEKIIRKEVASIARKGLSKVELERAKAQVEAQTAYHRDSPAQVAAGLAEAISSVDWRFYLDYPDRIKAVGHEDLLRVAAGTFVEDSVSVGYFIPKDMNGGAGAVPHAGPPALRARPCFYRAEMAPLVREAALPAGGRILLLPRHTNTTVHLHGSLLAGHGLLEVGEWSAASFVPDMLERGTSRHTRIEIARLLEDRGIELDVSADAFNPLEVFCSGRCLARHLPLVLELLAEMLLAPAFPTDEVEKLRTLRLGELAQAQEDTFHRAFESFSRLTFPAGHPHCRRPFEERRAGLEGLTREQLVAVHGKLYGPASMVLAIVGDFEAGEVEQHLGELFGVAHGGRREAPPIARRGPRDVTPAEARESMSDKPNLDVVLGHPGALRRADDDFIAATLGNSVLGHSTLSSRLGMRLRDREGLTYGVISRFFGASLLDGPWAVTFSVAPPNLDRALVAVREELERFVAEGPSEAELDDERAAMAGSYRVSLATPTGLARELARLVRHGLPVTEIDHIPERVLATGRGDVIEAVRRHLDPTRLCLAVAGDLVAKQGSAV